MDDADNNYFGDGKNLVYGCFPRMESLTMYWPYDEDKNRFTEQCFPAKMQAALEYLCMPSLT